MALIVKKILCRQSLVAITLISTALILLLNAAPTESDAGTIVLKEQQALERILINAGLKPKKVRIFYEHEDWEYIDRIEGYLAVKQKDWAKKIIHGKNFFYVNKNGHIISISLNSCSFNDIQLFSPLKKIKAIALLNNPIDSLEKMPHLPELEELVIFSCVIEKIEGLKNTPNLKILDLHNNRIEKIENLDDLSELKILDLSYNKINKLEGLKNGDLLRLKIRTMFNSKQECISVIEGLDDLTRLKELDLINQPIKKIEGLDKLINLETLVLAATDIKKIENLEKLRKLKKLSIGGTRVDSLKGIDRLTELRFLGISNLPIARFPEGLGNLQQLEELEAVEIQINTLKDIPPLRNLKQLNLDNSPISSLQGLDRLPSLEFVDLSGTKVTRLTHYENLRNMTLWLSAIERTPANEKAIKVMLKNKVRLRYRFIR